MSSWLQAYQEFRTAEPLLHRVLVFRVYQFIAIICLQLLCMLNDLEWFNTSPTVIMDDEEEVTMLTLCTKIYSTMAVSPIPLDYDY
ncbi:uncharacterized protein N7515_007032 [Penicillium bovifimosum]|uniref:Uncharacterized protein n=1 Tax=Penicillium bovifimosum TaxID=126998 RepID=A0A9W9GW27_9EURO|nr:uncharacterized protein N7515_007032 [Penicillium bovifimosum]KAJ5130993.1 hypothetical protein N7515_007032 [Penicillium bovifimosum]